MKPELLATLRAAGAAATKGPWKASDSHGLCVIRTGILGDLIADMSPESGWSGRRENATFIALARNHWDELLDAAEERDRLRAALRRYGNHDDCYRAGVDACPRYDNDNGGDPSRPCTCGFSAALGKEAP